MQPPLPPLIQQPLFAIGADKEAQFSDREVDMALMTC